MNHKAHSIRAFIGAKNFEESRSFYTDLGFVESKIDDHMSYFKIFDSLGFYLQNAFVEDWVNNTMLFLEVDDMHTYCKSLQNLNLHQKYASIKLTPIVEREWGRECFLHDPSGILWHFGEFKPVG